MTEAIPTWLDREIYPFESHYVDVADGKMHYVDEGSGPVILMLHGTPTWSFLYRHLIAGLRDRYRVIAPDHLGSGLSEKTAEYSYRPADQARNLSVFIEKLGLNEFTMVVHDFGGPIGLSYALDHPQQVQRLILFNTWMWSLRGQGSTSLIATVLGSPFGRFLYRRMNVEFSVIVPSVYGDRSKFTKSIQTHYKGPFEDPLSTHIAWVYARELLGSSDWFESLWAKRENIRNMPALLIWGMQDNAFGPVQLRRWKEVFTQAEIHELPNVGHFVQDEAGQDVLPLINTFLEKNN